MTHVNYIAQFICFSRRMYKAKDPCQVDNSTTSEWLHRLEKWSSYLQASDYKSIKEYLNEIHELFCSYIHHLTNSIDAMNDKSMAIQFLIAISIKEIGKWNWMINIISTISKLRTYFQAIIAQEYSKSFYDEYEHDFIQSKMIKKCVLLFKVLKHNQFYTFNILVEYMNLDATVALRENKENNIDWLNDEHMKLRINDKNIALEDLKKYIVKKQKWI